MFIAYTIAQYYAQTPIFATLFNFLLHFFYSLKQKSSQIENIKICIRLMTIARTKIKTQDQANFEVIAKRKKILWQHYGLVLEELISSVSTSDLFCD